MHVHWYIMDIPIKAVIYPEDLEKKPIFQQISDEDIIKELVRCPYYLDTIHRNWFVYVLVCSFFVVLGEWYMLWESAHWGVTNRECGDIFQRISQVYRSDELSLPQPQLSAHNWPGGYNYWIHLHSSEPSRALDYRVSYICKSSSSVAEVM